MRKTWYDEDEYFVVNGRKMTKSGFCQAVNLNGKPMVFRTTTGKTEPVMMGVSEFGHPGKREFFRSDNHEKSHRVPAHPVFWLPNARGYRHGETVDMALYIEARNEPERWRDELDRLASYGIGLDIDCN